MAYHIKDSLNALLSKNSDWRINLLSNWSTVMGGLSERVCLEKVKGNCLTLGVYESSWLQELYLLSPTLIKTINEYLQGNYVTELRFKSAAKKKVAAKKDAVTRRRTTAPARALSAEEEAVLAEIKDPQLRSVLQGYLQKCHGEKL